MTDVELVDTIDGVAVVVPPHLCRAAGAALRAAIDDLERRSRRRASGSVVDLADRLALAASLTEQTVPSAELGHSQPGSFLDVRQAAARLAMSPEMVRRKCRQGRLRGAWRVGRTWLIPVEAIEERLR
jgi:excisionase family DNA binding protein